MRQTIFVLSCALFSVAGCGDDTTSKAGDMSVGGGAGDLSASADLSVRKPDGVACGSMTCAVGQDCCVATANNMVAGETCIAGGSSCAGGSVLSCDGPEDCSGGASPFCCATLNLGASGGDGGLPAFAGGSASCTATCGAALNGTSSITTRLCHDTSDCSGLSLAPFGAASCCSSDSAPGLHFCAVAVPLLGITCS